jgi:hypothetical protein
VIGTRCRGRAQARIEARDDFPDKTGVIRSKALTLRGHESRKAAAELAARAVEKALGGFGGHVEFGGYLGVCAVVELVKDNRGALATGKSGNGPTNDARQFRLLQTARRRKVAARRQRVGAARLVAVAGVV